MLYVKEIFVFDLEIRTNISNIKTPLVRQKTCRHKHFSHILRNIIRFELRHVSLHRIITAISTSTQIYGYI